MMHGKIMAYSFFCICLFLLLGCRDTLLAGKSSVAEKRTIPRVVNQTDTLPVANRPDTLPAVNKPNKLPIVNDLNTLPAVNKPNKLPVVNDLNTIPEINKPNKLPVVNDLNTIPGINKPNKLPVVNNLNTIPGVNKPNTPDMATDGIHDPTNPALATMQNPSQALSVLPIGQWKEIDWMLALKQNKIQPRASLKATGKMEILDMDIIMTNTKSMPHIQFPHISHTRWLACSNCHPAIFQAKKGSNPITMNAILKGQYCGVCHGKVAFSSFICQRCHNVTHDGSPNKWWK